MKKVATVVGLGISGAGAARLLNKKGWEVRITEGADTPEVHRRVKALEGMGNIKFEIGRHTRDFVTGSDLIVTSPGVKDSALPLVWARKEGIPVIDEIELGYRFCPCRIVAVTGTNGKSTTVTLISEILKAAGKDAICCGNIGVSFCEEVLKAKRSSIIVLEISSFQLQRVDTFRPYCSLLLNISQNHLDRHKDFKEYLNAKLNIFKNQKKTDWAILNREDRNLKYLDKHVKPKILYFSDSADADGACARDGAIYLVRGKRAQRIIPIDEITLRGEHNVRNAMAALLVAEIFKIKEGVAREIISKFKGLQHRCEYVAEINGVKFINDSKATTVDAAMCAIRSFKEGIILIAGGKDKGSDFTAIKSLIEQRAKHLILIGDAKAKIRTQLLGSVPMHEARDLEGAVSMGLHLARRGEIVLLSPMCASFDMFENFEDRGEQFKKAVLALKAKTAGVGAGLVPALSFRASTRGAPT